MNIGKANTKYGKINYLVNDCYIAPSLKENKMYSEFEIENVIKPYIVKSKVILDVGAHIGCHTITYAYMSPEAKIYSFEIQKPIYNLLRMNIEENKYEDRVKAYYCAVGNKIQMVNLNKTIKDNPDGCSEYNYNDGKKYNFGGLSLGTGGEDIIMITIDSLELDNCDFLKIDVEGFEYLVVLGALKTITKYHPTIYFECRDDKNISKELMEIGNIKNLDISNDKNIVFRLLYNLGYRKWEIHEENILMIYDI